MLEAILQSQRIIFSRPYIVDVEEPTLTASGQAGLHGGVEPAGQCGHYSQQPTQANWLEDSPASWQQEAVL